MFKTIDRRSRQISLIECFKRWSEKVSELDDGQPFNRASKVRSQSKNIVPSTLHCTASPLRSFEYARSSCKEVYVCEGKKAVGKSVWQGRARVYGSRQLAVQV